MARRSSIETVRVWPPWTWKLRWDSASGVFGSAIAFRSINFGLCVFFPSVLFNRRIVRDYEQGPQLGSLWLAPPFLVLLMHLSSKERTA